MMGVVACRVFLFSLLSSPLLVISVLSVCSFTLREPVIEQKTSVGVAVGVSIAFAFLYMLICLSCMVRRLQLNKSSWTSAASVSQIQVRPSMGNTDGVSLGAGQPSFFARSGSVWSHRSSADGISMQHRNSDVG